MPLPSLDSIHRQNIRHVSPNIAHVTVSRELLGRFDVVSGFAFTFLPARALLLVFAVHRDVHR